MKIKYFSRYSFSQQFISRCSCFKNSFGILNSYKMLCFMILIIFWKIFARNISLLKSSCKKPLRKYCAISAKLENWKWKTRNFKIGSDLLIRNQTWRTCQHDENIHTYTNSCFMFFDLQSLQRVEFFLCIQIFALSYKMITVEV